MTLKPNHEPHPETPPDLANEALPPAEETTQDQQTQDKYRKAYIEQLRRLSCPGCGEDFTFF